jgi:fatty-acid desaturase
MWNDRSRITAKFWQSMALMLIVFAVAILVGGWLGLLLGGLMPEMLW